MSKPITSEFKLKNLVNGIFSKDQMQKIDDQWLNQSVHLNEVIDLQKFVDDCELESKNFKTAGPERKSDWEFGWAGNGVTNDSKDFPNIPYYFKKNKYIRLGDRVFEDISGYTELRLLRMLQDIAFEAVDLSEVASVIEYGAGTGHNLVYLKKRISKNFYSADWAMSAVESMVTNGVVEDENSFRVDYFDNTTYQAPRESYAAFTNASLEQAGEHYKEFMNYLLTDPNCRVGIHIEPISDLVEPNSQLNIQSKAYCEQRKYLTGFYEFMKQQRVEIVLAHDFGIGSRFLSGYQVLVWRK